MAEKTQIHRSNPFTAKYPYQDLPSGFLYPFTNKLPFVSLLLYKQMPIFHKVAHYLHY